jgi:endonuclease III
MTEELKKEIEDTEALLESVRASVDDYIDISGYMVNKNDEVTYLERKLQHLRAKTRFSVV